MKHKTQKKRPKAKIVRTADYNCWCNIWDASFGVSDKIKVSYSRP